MDFLAFTYDEPTEKDVPLWGVGTPRDTAVAIQWRPSIGCTAEQAETGQALTALPGIPWHDLNLREIRVESRKAYEILNRIVPPGQNLFVRINPPKMEAPDEAAMKIRQITIFTGGDLREFTLAAQVMKDLSETYGMAMYEGIDDYLVRETHVAVFMLRTDSTAEQLAHALTWDCKVLSSDAGASEEYLARFAKPGDWHVAKTWDRREWRNMLLDLLRQPNEVSQTSIVDQTPYIRTWSEKDEN